MPENEKHPKLKLSKSPEQFAAEEKARKDANEPAKPNPPLTLNPAADTGESEPSTDTDKIRVEDILEDAYAPEKKRARQAATLRSIMIVGSIALLFIVSAALTFSYSHLLRQWPTLQPSSWYLPFILSVALSVAALVKSYQFMTRKHSSLTLTITGLVIAAGIANWNLAILRVASLSGSNASGTSHWQPSNQTEMLIAHEINNCRNIPTANFSSASAANYQKMFRSMPRSEWRQYFKQYLTNAELQKVTPINIDDMMREVAARMERLHREQWADFQAAYDAPSFDFKVQQWALRPYTYILQQL